MPLEKKTINFPFAGGVDTKTNDRHVGPGKLLALSNGEFNEPVLPQTPTPLMPPKHAPIRRLFLSEVLQIGRGLTRSGDRIG